MNILIIRFSSLGDLVTLSLVIRTIKYFYPSANLTFLTSQVGKELYQDTPFFDNYIVHKNFLNTRRTLKKQNYHIIFNLQCNSLSHLLLIGIGREKIVYAGANILEKILNIKKQVKSIKNTLIDSGIPEKRILKYLSIEENNYIFLDSTLKYDLPVNQKIISISTGSSKPWPSKQWGIENYHDLIKKILALGYQVVLIGTKLEENDAKKLNQKETKIINLVNKTNLTQLKSILKQSILYIGNDSGPSHLAAAVGTNTITIFGSTDIKHCVKNMPYTANHICIKPSENIECHPCYKGICPKNMECMKSISVMHVFDKVKNILN